MLTPPCEDCSLSSWWSAACRAVGLVANMVVQGSESSSFFIGIFAPIAPGTGVSTVRTWGFVSFSSLLGDFGAEYSSMRIHLLPFATRVAKLSPVPSLPGVCISGFTSGSTSASISGLTFASVGIGSVFTGVDAC